MRGKKRCLLKTKYLGEKAQKSWLGGKGEEGNYYILKPETEAHALSTQAKCIFGMEPLHFVTPEASCMVQSM